MSQQIEAVFENGVFRPLEPVALREHQRVTLQLSEAGEVDSTAPAKSIKDLENAVVEEDEWDEEITYEPLPLRECKTIRVKFKDVGKIPLLPYPVEEDNVEKVA